MALTDKPMFWKTAKLYALIWLIAFGFGVFLSWAFVTLVSN
jgi:hypothetical protein